MTREEAIDVYNGLINTKIKEAFEFFAPELREINKEEIRKDIIGGLMWQRDNLKSEGPHDNNLILPGFCLTVGEHLTYLEKQKDLDKMIVVSPDVWDNAITDAYENGKKDGEKQKEQNGEDEEYTDFTIYRPLKNEKGKYECIPYSFYGSLTSFSEDKDLIDFLRTCFYTKEECEEWIEKQKEQKPVVTHGETYHVDTLGTQQVIAGKMQQKPAWSEEDEKMLVHVVELLELNCDFSEINNEISWLKSLSRKKIWNKEDERILKGIVGLIDHNQHYDVSNKDMLNWLKSLRPQPHWKPSEEQISSLKQARDYYMSGRIKYVGRHLSEIAEQLEKLM